MLYIASAQIALPSNPIYSTTVLHPSKMEIKLLSHKTNCLQYNHQINQHNVLRFFRLKSTAPVKGRDKSIVALGGYLTVILRVIIWFSLILLHLSPSKPMFPIAMNSHYPHPYPHIALSPSGVGGCRWDGREKDAVEPGEILFTIIKTYEWAHRLRLSRSLGSKAEL